MKEKKRIRVLGVPIDSIDMSGAMEYFDRLIQENKKGSYVLAVNTEKVIALQRDTSLQKIFENASLLIPDGIGVIFAIRWLYRLQAERVPGVDLMHNICVEAARKGYRIFIYGADEEVNKEAVEKLRILYSGIRIVGRCNGYIPEDKMNNLINNINAAQADILFVALGSPKQEKWIRKYLPKLNIKVCQAIGGTLDTITGKTRRAPAFIQKLGLEWLYRLIKEPRRFRRQIVLPIFVMKVLKEKWRLKELM